jgi:hypothetical protein
MDDYTSDTWVPSTDAPFDPAFILISNDFAWEGVPESKSASFCGNVPLRGINKRTGLPVSFTVPCGTLFHQPCAEAKVISKLQMMHARVALSRSCFFAVVRTVEFRKDRLSDRRYRLAKKLDRLVWYVWVQRADGWTYIFASDPLTGRKEPLTFYESEKLLPIVANAMMLPGVLRIQPSRAGLSVDDHDDHGDDEVEYLGFAGDVMYRRAVRIAAEIALERYGIEVDLLAPTRLDGGVTPEQWIDCMQQAWARVRSSASTGP